MTDEVRDFYNALADDYHLIFADWEASIIRQAGELDKLIADQLGPGAKDALDCACGIGTQTIGLARLGHRVHATDLSPRAVARLGHELEQRGLTAETGVADLRTLDTDVVGDFDVVLALDNALPHLPDLADLDRAVAGMAKKLRPGGLFMVSTRDYDLLRVERPRADLPRPIDGPDGRRITFQVWDWAEDGSSYRLQQFIVRAEGTGWRTECYESRYTAFTRADLNGAAERAGLDAIQWLKPDVSGFFQPLMLARKPEADRHHSPASP
jgi:SAM-dependent methyltransferase